MCGTDTTTLVTRSATVANGGARAALTPESTINLDQGDPAMFEEYWRKRGEECRVTIGGSELMSYFSNAGSVCWFMMVELDESIRRVHRLVGNAAVDGRHIVVGTGSTQLFQAVLYALCSDPQARSEPVSVVGAAPYYSCYPEVTDFLKSGLYKWEGDAHSFDKDGPYIELVTTPNNPDGSIRGPVVNRSRSDGKLVYDLAYYWPQYTPITHQADHDIMLFTFSKSTGHAGSRIGWAIVKDYAVAKKMVNFIELTSIGVSKEAQLRAATIIGSICDEYEDFGREESENFFEYSKRLMSGRWEKLREVLKNNEVFSLPKFSREYCLFSTAFSETYPAFAWLKCKDEMKDAEAVLRCHKILARGGSRFGADATLVRVSMLSRQDAFELFLERLSNIRRGITSNGNHV